MKKNKRDSGPELSEYFRGSRVFPACKFFLGNKLIRKLRLGQVSALTLKNEYFNFSLWHLEKALPPPRITGNVVNAAIMQIEWEIRDRQLHLTPLWGHYPQEFAGIVSKSVLHCQ